MGQAHGRRTREVEQEETPMKCCPMLLVVALAAPATAQVVNGNFETGALPPWVVTPTPQGGTLFQNVIQYDIDGAGPRPPSYVLQLMVGQTAPNVGNQGVRVTQLVNLQTQVSYRASVQWSVRALVNAYNANGGIFELILDGQSLASGSSGVLPPLGVAYGTVSAGFSVQQPGAHEFGVRVTRPALRGEEIFQYVDNLVLSIACYANCDESTSAPVLNVNDFVCFQTRFAAGDLYADCDLGGTLNVNDFVCFQGAFAAGCP